MSTNNKYGICIKCGMWTKTSIHNICDVCKNGEARTLEEWLEEKIKNSVVIVEDLKGLEQEEFEKAKSSEKPDSIKKWNKYSKLKKNRKKEQGKIIAFREVLDKIGGKKNE